MAELHLLLVIDSDSGTVRVTGLEEAPVDSKGVWDPDTDVWRYPTDDELDQLMRAEAHIAWLVDTMVVPLTNPDPE